MVNIHAKRLNKSSKTYSKPLLIAAYYMWLSFPFLSAHATELGFERQGRAADLKKN